MEHQYISSEWHKTLNDTSFADVSIKIRMHYVENAEV